MSGINNINNINNISEDLDSTEQLSFPFWKRFIDLSLICVGFPFWAGGFVVIGTWIWISSDGPIFYRQVRIGHRRRTFSMIKFRSMVPDADQRKHDEHVAELIESGKPLTKLDTVGDARLVPGGGFLRSSGLDELPQILNVIRGEMSLVGPRPCTLAECNKYTHSQLERFNAPPGVTGYWQVNGKNKTTFPEMNAMDIHYTRKMTPLLDLLILTKTPRAILEQLNLWQLKRQAKKGSATEGISGSELPTD